MLNGDLHPLPTDTDRVRGDVHASHVYPSITIVRRRVRRLERGDPAQGTPAVVFILHQPRFLKGAVADRDVDKVDLRAVRRRASHQHSESGLGERRGGRASEGGSETGVRELQLGFCAEDFDDLRHVLPVVGVGVSDDRVGEADVLGGLR